jgi:hypothetical protein
MKKGFSFIADIMSIFIFVVVLLFFYFMFKFASAKAQERAISTSIQNNEIQLYLTALLDEPVYLHGEYAPLGSFIGEAVLMQDDMLGKELQGLIVSSFNRHYDPEEHQWFIIVDDWPGPDDMQCCSTSILRGTERWSKRLIAASALQIVPGALPTALLVSTVMDEKTIRTFLGVTVAYSANIPLADGTSIKITAFVIG